MYVQRRSSANAPSLLAPSKLICLNTIGMSTEVGHRGTPHIQGFVQYKAKRVSRSRAKSSLNCPRGHFATAKGTAMQNLQYISKDSRDGKWPQLGMPLPKDRIPSHYKLYEFGTPRKQGERSDMIKLRNLLKAGRSYRSLIQDDEQEKQFGNLIRYSNGIEKAINAFVVPRTSKPTAYWFGGDSQAGKSTDAFSLVEEGQTCYFKSENNKWWPGYNGQDVVIWNDIRGGKEVDFTLILRLLDPGAIYVQKKNGYDVQPLITTAPLRTSS